jgi:hypothetical protein
MTQKIPIRNRKLPKEPRVFDVTVNESGEILRYDMQNIKGSTFIEEQDVKQQIKEALKKKAV